jgi:hypothetical protein
MQKEEVVLPTPQEREALKQIGLAYTNLEAELNTSSSRIGRKRDELIKAVAPHVKALSPRVLRRYLAGSAGVAAHYVQDAVTRGSIASTKILPDNYERLKTHAYHMGRGAYHLARA